MLNNNSISHFFRFLVALSCATFLSGCGKGESASSADVSRSSLDLTHYPLLNSYAVSRHFSTFEPLSVQPLVFASAGEFVLSEEIVDLLGDRGGSQMTVEVTKGTVLGVFPTKHSVLSAQLDSLLRKYEKEASEFKAVGELLEKQADLTNRERIADMEDRIRIAEAIEADPELAGVLSAAGANDLNLAEGAVEAMRLNLAIMKRKLEVEGGVDRELAFTEKKLGLQAQIEELKQAISFARPVMPFDGTLRLMPGFSDRYGDGRLSRIVQSGDVLGTALDLETIFLSVPTNDTSIATLAAAGDNLTASVTVMGSVLHCDFSGIGETTKGFGGSTEEMPVYRFLLPADTKGIPVHSLVGTRTYATINKLTDAPVKVIPKMRVLAEVINVPGYDVMGNDWIDHVQAIAPEWTLVSDTDSQVIISLKP